MLFSAEVSIGHRCLLEVWEAPTAGLFLTLARSFLGLGTEV